MSVTWLLATLLVGYLVYRPLGLSANCHASELSVKHTILSRRLYAENMPSSFNTPKFIYFEVYKDMWTGVMTGIQNLAWCV